MRKFLLLIIIILMPFSVMAVGVSSSNLSGAGNAKEGDSFTITFSANLNGVGNSEDGIYAIGFDIEYDEDVLALRSISSPGYNSAVIEEDGDYVVLSEPINANCVGGVLSCSGSYSVTLSFYVNNTDETSTEVYVNDLVIGYAKTNIYGEYSEDDLDMKEVSMNKKHYLSLTQASGDVQNKSSISTSNKSISSVATKKANSTNSNTKKDDNKNTDSTNSEEKIELKKEKVYLKSLEIKGYKIDFKKDVYKYEITIPRDVNELEVKAVGEDEKYKVRVIGASDLVKNEDKVKIYVYSSSGASEVYIININREKYDDSSIISKLNNYLFIGIGVLVGLVVLIIIISVINKRNFNKMIDDEINRE